ncbi:MAG: hypothetical protein RIC36_16410 [Rhodospirillales bacterium]
MQTPAYSQQPGARVIGLAVVIDARTVEIGGQLLTLWKIEAPSPQQQCLRQGVVWECGQIARDNMRDIVRGRELDCLVMTGDEGDGLPAARCYLGYSDIAAALIDRGYALAIDVRSSPYRQNHREARGANRGIFSGLFMDPAKWRAGERLPGL